MDFKAATNLLFTRTDHEALAARMGVSVALIRQARLADEAKAFRNPPQKWKAAVKALAIQRKDELNALIEQLEKTEH